MAKYEKILKGDFDLTLAAIEEGIMKKSVSVSLEDGSEYTTGNIRCAVRVFERYSTIGGNRVSLNVTMIGNDTELFVSGITSGGSQAVFFKMNTFGEEAFLETLEEVLEELAN